MYFTDESVLPENQDPLIITAAPYGPAWVPDDYPGQVPTTWKEQVQSAVDCYNAGATILHIHVRDPKTGHISKNFQEYADQIGRLRQAVPKMILQLGGSISFAPEPGASAAKWLSYDTRHMLTEIDPKPDQVTVTVGSSLYDLTPLTVAEDVKGTQLADPAIGRAYSNMVVDSTPEFYVEHVKRLSKQEIQPYFALTGIYGLAIIERLVRQGVHKGPVNGFFSMLGGGGAGSNPIDWMDLVKRTPQGSVWTYQTMWRYSWPLAAFMIAIGQHTRAGIEENFWGTDYSRRITSVEMIEKNVRMAKELGRPIASAEDARRVLKIGTWYNTAEETLFNLGLPPNRTSGLKGSLVYDTDGRLPKAAGAGAPSATMIL